MWWFMPTDQQWAGGGNDDKGITTVTRPDEWSSQKVLGQPELHGESVQENQMKTKKGEHPGSEEKGLG